MYLAGSLVAGILSAGVVTAAPAPTAAKSKQSTNVVRLAVRGLHCDGCAAAVEKALNGVKGVKSAKVDRKAGHAVVSTDGKTKPEELVSAVNRTKKFSATVEK
jgi:copper chaperone CopZ